MKRKFIDERGRLFGTVSVIDVVVIVVVLVLIGAIYAKFNLLDKTSTSVPMTAVTYEIEAKALRYSAAESFRAGDKLYSSTGTDLGVITEVKSSPAMKATPLSDGTLVLSAIENRCDVLLTVEAPCLISEGRYYVSRTYEINVNSDRDLLTKYNTFEGTIVGIDK